MTYKEFLERKIDIAPLSGIEIDPAEVSPALKDHQRVSVLWALRGAAVAFSPASVWERPSCSSNGADCYRSTRADRRSL